MKKLLWTLLILWWFMATSYIHALSFWPDTIFLDADTQESCHELWWSFTERYGEIYCTTVPSEILTPTKQKAIKLVSTQIINMIDGNSSLYTEYMSLLDTYKNNFLESKDTTRAAIVIMLQTEIEIDLYTIPTSCIERYDGCNNCSIASDWDMACTEIYCTTRDLPYCIQHQ